MAPVGVEVVVGVAVGVVVVVGVAVGVVVVVVVGVVVVGGVAVGVVVVVILSTWNAFVPESETPSALTKKGETHALGLKSLLRA